MKDFKKIEYIDAKYYIGPIDFNNESFFSILKLDKHTAYGKIEENNLGDFIVSFINEVKEKVQLDQNQRSIILEGVIIPKHSLIEYKENYKSDYSFLEKVNKNIEVEWKDVVHVRNANVTECSIMSTKGLFAKDYQDFILIKNPVTLRLSPLPVISHPNIKIELYVIPKSFILKIKEV